MNRYTIIFVGIILLIFAIVAICAFSLLRPKTKQYGSERGIQLYFGITPALEDLRKMNQTKYEHIIKESNQKANIINELDHCSIWSADDKVASGTNAEIGDYPCMALLEYMVDFNKYDFGCDGSLINHRYVITAAHCLHGKYLINVRLGELDTSKDVDCEDDDCVKALNVGVENTVIHEQYSPEKLVNDIGLIRLAMDVQYKRYFIKPICIPNSTIITQVGEGIVVAGWGSNGTLRHMPILQKLTIKIFDFEKCKAVYTGSTIHPSNISSQLCAGGEEGKDACIRDSGGPLIMHHNKNSYIEGIVSFGSGCGKKGVPGVYTRVSSYYDWITHNLVP